MDYALATLLSPRLKCCEVLGRHSWAQHPIVSVTGLRQWLIQSKWERLRARYIPGPASHSLYNMKSHETHRRYHKETGGKEAPGGGSKQETRAAPQRLFCEKGWRLSTQLGAKGTLAMSERACTGWLSLTRGDLCHLAAPVTAQPGCWPRGRALHGNLMRTDSAMELQVLEQGGLCCCSVSETAVAVKGG